MLGAQGTGWGVGAEEFCGLGQGGGIWEGDLFVSKEDRIDGIRGSSD